MYDWPEIRGETDRFWATARACLRDEGLVTRESLARGADISAPWKSPNLALGQTCGLPLVLGLAEPAIPFARPTYAVEGCGAGTYRSCFLARAEAGACLEAFRGKRLALNGWDSQSGCNALADALRALAPPGAAFFRDVMVTGAHRASADAVAEGDADLCALDAVAWALYRQAEPRRAARLNVIGWSAEVPALPFVTAPRFAGKADLLRRALAAAARAVQGCAGLPVEIIRASRDDYAPIAAMAAACREMAFAPQARSQS